MLFALRFHILEQRLILRLVLCDVRVNVGGHGGDLLFPLLFQLCQPLFQYIHAFLDHGNVLLYPRG